VPGAGEMGGFDRQRAAVGAPQVAYGLEQHPRGLCARPSAEQRVQLEEPVVDKAFIFQQSEEIAEVCLEARCLEQPPAGLRHGPLLRSLSRSKNAIVQRNKLRAPGNVTMYQRCSAKRQSKQTLAAPASQWQTSVKLVQEPLESETDRCRSQ